MLLLVPCLLQEPNVAPAETVVTAPRSQPTLTTPAADVVVVTAQELRATGERSLPRAIARAAGTAVWMQETNTGGGSPILRGLVGPHVLIVVDGVRLNDSTTRLGPNQSLNTIDIEIVERVEIIQGPSAVLYGSDAVGGTLLIWTKRRAPGSAARTGNLGAVDLALSGQYESASDGGRAAVDTSWAGESDGLRVIGSVFEHDDLRSGGGEVDFTGYHATGFFTSWDHALSDEQSLRAILRIHRDFDVPRTDRLLTGYGQVAPSNAEFDFALQDNTAYTLVFDDHSAGALSDRMQARMFLRNYDEQRRVRNTGSTARRVEHDEITGYGFGLDFQKRLGEDHHLTYGVDFERDDVDSERSDTNIVTSVVTPRPGTFAPNSHYSSAGVFLQDEITSFAPVALTAGLRYSRFDFSFNEFTATPAGGPEQSGGFDAWTASLQASHELSEGLRLTATVAQGFRAPKLDDLAKNSTIFGGTELANPDLDPEESLSGSLALDIEQGPWRAGVSAYHATLSDFIGRVLTDLGDPGTTGDETYLRENVGTVEFVGVNLGVRRQLGDESSPWNAGVGASWTKGRQYDDTVNPATGTADFNDVPARRIPPLFGYAALGYEASTLEHTIAWGELRLTAADDQGELHPEDLSDPRINPDGTAGWATLDFDLGGPLGGAGSSSGWNLGFHNIFDREYRVHGSGFDSPGFNVIVGLHWAF